MLNRLRGVFGAALLVSALALGTAASAGAADKATTGTGTQTIAAIAISDPSLSTLVAALKAADLVKTLEGPGPFTVFAPTDAAFAKIPTGILDYLLANPAVLKDVLLYHVVSGLDGIGSYPIKTLQGGLVTTYFYFDHFGKLTLKLNDSNVSLTPVNASNGVVYIIDSVLQPQFR